MSSSYLQMAAPQLTENKIRNPFWRLKIAANPKGKKKLFGD
jgi:hypothetical protein